jgi:hypothetical protein
MDNSIDITLLIEDINNFQLQKMIRELHGFYYPTDHPDMDIMEEKQHILCMIEKDSKATLVTDDPVFVLNNVTIGGDFENNYEGSLYSTFNSAIIANRAQGRRTTKVLMKSKFGSIRLTTGMLTIINVVNNDNGMEIVARTNDFNTKEGSFQEFCNLLEGNVYRMYRAGGVTKNILNDRGELKFVVPRYVIDNQTTKGVSCLRNQRGGALNIEDDLRAGDIIQVMFLTEIVMYPDDRSVTLKPLKFVKYQPYDPSDTIKQQTEDDELDKEIDLLASKVEFISEIGYE